MQKRLLIALFLFFASAALCHAQQPVMQWQNLIGGEAYDEGVAVKRVYSLKAFFTVSNTTSSPAYIYQTPPYKPGKADVYFAQHSFAQGNDDFAQWIGTPQNDYVAGMDTTNDGTGNLVIVGYTDSTSYDENKTIGKYNQYNYNAFIERVNSLGQKIWYRNIGGWGDDYIRAVRHTSDNGFIVVGSTNSDSIRMDSTFTRFNPITSKFDKIDTVFYSPTRNRGDFDFWVLKLDKNGKTEWRNTFGGSTYDEARAVFEYGGNYYVGGVSKSKDLQVSGNKGGLDYWVIKITLGGKFALGQPGGAFLSGNNFGGTGDDIMNAMEISSAGMIYMGGTSTSADLDASDHHAPASLSDGFIVAANTAFTKNWSKSYGGSRADGINDLILDFNGKLTFSGYTSSTDYDAAFSGPVAHSTGAGAEAWVVNILNPPASGAINWEKPMGSSYDEKFNGLVQDIDGGYISIGAADLPANKFYGFFDDVRPISNAFLTDTAGLFNLNGCNYNLDYSLYPNKIVEMGGKDMWLAKLGGNCVAPGGASGSTFDIVNTVGDYPQGNTDSICPGTAVTLRIINQNSKANVFSSFHWQIDGLPVSTAADTTVIFNNATTSPYTVTITGIASKGAGCSGSVSKTLKVNPNPVVPPFTSSKGFALCANASTTLAVSFTPNYKYQFFANELPVTALTATPTYKVNNAKVSTKYHVIVQNYSGCKATGVDTTVVVDPNPVKTPIYAPKVILCPLESVSLSAPTGDYTYNWSPTSSTASSIVVSSAGSYVVTITQAYPNDNISCSTVLVPVTVTLDPIPTLAITPSTPAFCDGLSSTLTASPGFASYHWSDEEDGSSITVKTATPNTIVGTGTYTVVGTDANGCTATASKQITVYPNPQPVLSPTQDVAVCFGNSVPLSLTQNFPGATYAWLYDSNSVTQVLPVTTSTYDASVTGAYSVSVTDGNSCVGVATFRQITIYDQIIDTVVAYTPLQVCDYDYILLGATPQVGTSYTWYDAGGPIAGETSRTLKITNGTVGPVYCKLDMFGCTAQTVPVNIQFFTPISNLTINNNTPLRFCEGGAVNLSSSSPLSTYIWSDGYDTPNIDVIKSESNITLQGIDMNGCKTNVTPPVSVLVDTLPDAKITGPQAFCNGVGANLSVKNTYSSYLWGGTASNNPTTSTIFASLPGTYDVTVTDVNGCSNTSSFFLRKDSYLQENIVAVGDTDFCEGNTVTLIDNDGQDGDIYYWSTGGSAIADNYAVINYSGDFFVSVTNKYGCSGVSNSIHVNVKPAPYVSISPSGKTSFCKGDNVVITATSTVPGSIYSWSNGAPATDVITVSDSGQVYVLATAPNGCENKSNTIDIVVYDLPSVQITSQGQPTEFCAGNDVILHAGQFATYLWSDLSKDSTVDVRMTGTYTVSVTNNNGCSAYSAPFSVVVHPLPPVPVITAHLQLLHSDAPNNNQWYFNKTVIDSAVNPDYYAKKTGSYKVVVTNEYGCSSESAPVTVTIQNTGVEDMELTHSLHVYPNPFEGSFKIEYRLKQGTDVSIEVFDLLGKKVAGVQPKQFQSPGVYNYTVDLSDKDLDAGTYIIKISAGGTVYAARIIRSK